jgi:hypothetical protein
MKAFSVRAYQASAKYETRGFIVVDPAFSLGMKTQPEDDFQPRARLDLTLNMAPEVALQLASDLIAAAHELQPIEADAVAPSAEVKP